uniref:60S acidic ribosomal protein P0 n=1 Tax=Macrostomum lignano TaxID=282301 RepID=A0A1I8HF48_9PLAT
MVKGDKRKWKEGFFEKLTALLSEYSKTFIVSVDNVGSKQMQQIRQSMRNEAVILIGKNTMIRKVVRAMLDDHPTLEKLLPHIRLNVGFVFTNQDLNEVRKKIEGNQVAAPARAGSIAPCDVVVPAQNTGLGPEKTSFFQALNIQTKITRGTIEILSDVPLIKKNTKVGQSEATLLNMLKISPFSYGLRIRQVYDNGSVFGPQVLDIRDEDIVTRFLAGSRRVAALSLQLGTRLWPRRLIQLSTPLPSGCRGNRLRVPVGQDCQGVSERSQQVCRRRPGRRSGRRRRCPAAKEAKKEESSEESDDDMGMSLFD